MNSRRDIIAFCILAAISIVATMVLVVKNQHIPPKPKSDLWPKLTACKIDKHYLEGKYGIHYTPEVQALEGKQVTLDGFLLPLEAGEKSTHFLLTVRAPSCPYCLPAAPNEMAEVFTTKPLAWSDQMVSLSGTLKLMPDKSAEGIFFQLKDAQQAGNITSSATPELPTYHPKPVGEYVFIKPVDAQRHDFVHLSEWKGKPLLVMFWRADCPPCLIELRNLGDTLSKHSISTVLISLQRLEHARDKLPPLPPNVQVLATQEDGGELLAAFGNDKMLALPYSVMLDAEGNICGKHNGILTPAQINEWVKQCGKP